MVDGGWWEGILNDQVGWFPGNHVEEISPGMQVYICSPHCQLAADVVHSGELFSWFQGIG